MLQISAEARDGQVHLRITDEVGLVVVDTATTPTVARSLADLLADEADKAQRQEVPPRSTRRSTRRGPDGKVIRH